MNVLINCLSSRSGGAVSYLLNILPLLTGRLGAQGHELVVLARTDQQAMMPALPSRVIAIDADRVTGPRRIAWEARNLRLIAHAHEIGLIFTPYQVGTIVPGVVNVGMFRNMEPFSDQGYRYTLRSRVRNMALRRQTRRFLGRVDMVIAVSGFVAEFAEQGLGIEARRIATIHHGRDPLFDAGNDSADAATLRQLAIDRPFAFACGSLLPYRRLEDVIAAFGEFADGRDQQPLLVIAGSGSDSRYVRLVHSTIARSRVHEQIRYLGEVSRQTMATLYRQARLFVTATEVEACPNVAIEALSAGCAIVAAGVPVMREILGEAALFYPARSVTALAGGIRRGWENPEFANRLRASARTRAQLFSWDTCAARTADLLAGLADT